jgi:hypothetical protein
MAVAIGFLRLDLVETLIHCQERIVSTTQRSKQNTQPPRQTSETAEWVRAQVATAPPLTQEQSYRLRQVLGGVVQGRDDRSERIELAAENLGKTA